MMADLLKPTESSKLKERTLTETRLITHKEGSGYSRNLSGLPDVTKSAKEKSNMEAENSLPQANSENQKTESQNSSVDPKTSDPLSAAIAIEENDLDEYDPDLFITEEEKKAFEYMLEQKREEMTQRKENFQKWVDTITRRRMFALSRMRKINQGHTKRSKFYKKVDNFMNELYGDKDVISGEFSNPNEERDNVSDRINSQDSVNKRLDSVNNNESQTGSSRQTLAAREDTSFLPKPEVDTQNNQTPIVVPVQT